MSTSSRIPDHVREAVAARVPSEVREAFDAAVDARRRFHEATFMPNGGEKVRVRRKAVNDLAAANRTLAAYDKNLVERAGRVAAEAGEQS